ncbi:esterase-like activity of phytase family protein [Pseudoroseomonas globiformis]|uniref:Esterase-like activity of phytase family protein n=1 Tax=Teichococcus globiformis TaxID=2307229 RepID=A0ABV7FXF1_9PROT
MIASRRRALALGLVGLAGLGACAALRQGPVATRLPPLPLPADSPVMSHGGLAFNRHMMGFGGLSGLHIDDALNWTAVSDLGYWAQARLVPGPDGTPVGLEDLRTGSLRQEFPLPMPASVMRDAEALARLPEGGWLVSFERWHRICRYPELTARCERVTPAPPGLDQAPPNAGIESLTVLPDGRWLAVSEGLWMEDRQHLRAWIGRPGAWVPLRYRPDRNFVPTDAAALPDGRVLMVERRFSLLGGGFRGQLRLLPAEQLGTVVEGAVLAPQTLIGPDSLPADNWEGVAVFRHRGALWLALQVDDNEMAFQQGQIQFFSFR